MLTYVWIILQLLTCQGCQNEALHTFPPVSGIRQQLVN
jgi:hypothetical protein